MTRREILKKIGYPFLSVLLFLGVWTAAALAVGIEIILPTPLAALREFFAALGSASFWRGIGMSVVRTLAGFGISFVLALALAVISRLFPGFAAAMAPIVTILRSVPTIAVILIALVYLPSGRVPVLISFLIVFPLLYNSFFDALRSVSGELADMSRLYRVPRSVQLKQFYIPAILPGLFSASRGAIGLNLKTVVAAEAIAMTNMSLGKLLQNANVELASARLFAYTLAAVLVSFALEGLVLLVQKLTVRWRP